MHQRLKRWESPRKEGRNNKGKGGSARARQLKKQTQLMRQRLKEDNNKDKKRREENHLPAFFMFSNAPARMHADDVNFMHHYFLAYLQKLKSLIIREIELKADGSAVTVAATTIIAVASLTRVSDEI